MELRHLRYFLTICEERNISRAAKKLFMSQPPLSQQLKALEEELGVELFKRTTRSLEITEAGKVFQKKAVEILQLSDNMLKEVKSYDKKVTGTLRVGFVASSGATLLPDRIPEFYRKYPDINFQIKEGSTYRVLDLLDSGIIEVAIVRSPFNIKRYNSIELPTEPMIAIGTEKFLKNFESERIVVDELKNIPLIIDKRFKKLIGEACDQEGFAPRILCEGEDSRSLLLWAASGLGVALLPSSARKLMEKDNIMVKEIDCDLLKTKTLITWVKNRPLSVVAEKFIGTFDK